MKREHAIKALDNQKTLTHISFTPNEWVRGIGGGEYQFEDGSKCSSSEFWAHRKHSAFNKGWSEKLDV